MSEEEKMLSGKLYNSSIDLLYEAKNNKIHLVKDDTRDESSAQYGGTKMFFAPPTYYDELMKKVPKGKLITVTQMRDYLAKENNADFTDPMTAGIFVNIVAWASYQRNEDFCS